MRTRYDSQLPHARDRVNLLSSIERPLNMAKPVSSEVNVEPSMDDCLGIDLRLDDQFPDVEIESTCFRCWHNAYQCRQPREKKKKKQTDHWATPNGGRRFNQRQSSTFPSGMPFFDPSVRHWKPYQWVVQNAHVGNDSPSGSRPTSNETAVDEGRRKRTEVWT